MMQSKFFAYFIIVMILLSACTPQTEPVPQTAEPGDFVTHFPATSSSTAEAAPIPSPTVGEIPFSSLTYGLDPSVPAQLRSIEMPLSITSDPSLADLRLGLIDDPAAGVEWIYALVAPFPSLLDELSSTDLISAWQGNFDPRYTLFLEESTLAALQVVLGPSGANVEVLPAEDILAAAWDQEDSLAIVPFEELEPRWKVIVIDGQSPVHNDFRAATYPLKAYFGWQSSPEVMETLAKAVNQGKMPQIIGNRDPAQMTVLVMTGVTALVRATAVKMETRGITYPGEDIWDWLVNADLTHISNEVSFSQDCPDPKPDPMPLIFCSKPEYIELLDYIGTDILELTGNHGVDWGRDALIYSLGLYRDRDWYVYAAGENAEQAREAVKIEHNGNKLAFIGCNPVGPEFIWATENLPGVANCDYPWMWQRIRELTQEGFLVVATFQYFETYRHYVEPFEERDFRSMADAGAVIVSGSQSHHPMAMEFYQNSFIHYGLGNLFFDQMHTGGLIPEATRKEFIDRYVIYNNRHISTEILTALLEDFARPRPMTALERYEFLTEIFEVTEWGNVP